MKLPPFQLHRPRSVSEACELAQTHGFEASFLGGGTELILLMKLGLSAPSHLIDLKGVEGLGAVDEAEGEIRIGALVTHSQLEQHPTVRTRLPELSRISSILANRRVRGAGTLVGNLCFADPHSDPATLLTALDASLIIAGPGGSLRDCRLSEFWIGPYTTILGEGELVDSVRVSTVSVATRVTHERFKLKERPAVTVSACLEVDGTRVTSARVVAGSVEPLPRRLRSVERLLMDGGRDALAEVAGAASAETDPGADQDGSPDYKRHLVGVLTTRAIARALQDHDDRTPE